MAIEKIALDNVKRVIENDTVDASVHLDPGAVIAYEESVAAAENAE